MIRQHLFRDFKAGLVMLGIVSLCVVAASAQGRYSNVYSKSTVKGYIDRLERSSNTFRRDFDRFMDQSSLNGTNTEDEYNQLVKDYEDALDRLRSRFNSFQTWWESRSDVQEMLDRAQPVNTMVNRLPFSRNIESQWRTMRNDINVVADTYDLPGLAGGGWTGGGGVGPGPGDWGGPTSNPPSWAVGTWTMLNSSNSTLTINSNGGVTFDFGSNQITYGRYYQGTVYIGGARGSISRIGNNLRFYNQSTGAFTDYSRVGGGGGGGNEWDGPMSSPPSWSEGTWYAMDRSATVMTINRNGQITFNFNNQTTFGRYYRGTVYFAGSTATISRSGDNLRFYDQTSRMTVDYSRNNWGGGGNDWNGPMSQPPSWSQGTWYAMDRSRDSMTINRNGQIAFTFNNQTTYGRYYQGSIYFGGSRATISRSGNNLRFYDQSSGRTTEYSRTQWGGGGGWGNNADVTGTWRWTSGNDRRTMIIDRNGNVTVDANGVITNGTYSNGVLTLGNSRANVTRQGNQLRVNIQGSNESYTWYRQ